MQVLKRDNYRYVIYGRRAKDHVDLEPHVHHLIPWRMDGPTAEENLLTLCGACHKGLDPDYQPMLCELAGLPGPATPLKERSTEFDEEVARYRKWVAQQISKYENGVSQGALNAVGDEHSQNWPRNRDKPEWPTRETSSNDEVRRWGFGQQN
ncbi:hypothetical protein HNP40_001431 [Mycobacteroides chelonae]|nr:hypothetical protein [Mycobacteroides chelonae]